MRIRAMMQLTILFRPARTLLQLVVVLTCVAGDVATVPDTPVLQLASQQYPGYAPLLLQPTRTSSINAAVKQAVRQQDSSAAPAAVLVVLSSSKGSVLIVDSPITVNDGLSLAITTSAAMAAAAARSGTPSAAGGATIPAADLLLVRCSSSRSDGFLTASHAGDVFVSGLSIQRCPGSAVEVEDSRSLTITDTELTANNVHMGLENGGAVYLNNLQQVNLSHTSCTGNYALTKGGCLYLINLAGTLTVTHSRIKYNWKDDPDNGGGGSGIYVENADRFLVSHCDVSHNYAWGTGSNGGGISAQVVDVAVVGYSQFVNNSAALEGGGLNFRDVRELHIRDSNCTDNGRLPREPTAEEGSELVDTNSGAAIAVSGGRTAATNNINATLERVRFVGNRALSGGGITATQWGIGRGRLELEECVFLDNQGFLEAGGIYYNENWGSDVIMRRCVFDHNFGQYGGAASLYDSDVTVEDCNFTSNWATSDGGALQLQTNMGAGAGNSLRISRSIFTNNTSGALGGGVAVDGQALVVLDSLVADNYAFVGGGGVSVLSASSAEVTASTLVNNTAGDDGGGAVKLREVGRLNMTDVVIHKNKAVSGGGMLCDRIATTTLNFTTVTGNSAREAGGAAVMLQAGSVYWTNSTISGNSAPMGGALAIDSCKMVLTGVNLTHNSAGGAAGQTQQQGDVQQFSALVHVSGTAGAALIQRTSLTLDNCTISHNTAEHDAGAMLIQQPTALLFTSTILEANRALSGVGGGMVIRGTGKVATAQLQHCRFIGNVADVGSGGALVLDSGLGVLEFTCDGCQFDSNSAGQDGGGIAASGPTVIECTNCHTTNNKASHSGGWLYCAGCSNTSIGAGSSSSGNTAAASGGAIDCEGCGTFTSLQCKYSSNAAAAGGAVSVQAAAAVEVSKSVFDQNSATSVNDTAAAAAASGQLQLMNQLPPTWQLMYGVGSAAASGSVDCSSGGSGGGLCVAAAAAAQLTDLTLTHNIGGTGGALFASAACSDATAPAAEGTSANSSSSSCRLALANLSVTGNTATEAGGALYSSTPGSIILAPTAAAADNAVTAAVSVASWPFDQYQRDILLQQLARENSVSEGGYGPGAASFPASLSLMNPAWLSDNDETAMVSAIGRSTSKQQSSVSMLQRYSTGPATSQRQQQQHEELLGSHGRRLHQIIGQSSSVGHTTLKDRLLDMTRNLANKVSSADDDAYSAGSEFDATCPTLGATVLEPTRVGVDSFQVFSLPVIILDAFGSRVSRGPGSDWLVMLYQPSTTGVQLSGAARGRLSSGSTVLDGLTLSARSGNAYNMTLSAAQGQGSGGQQPNTTLHVEVRPCLPGQRAEFANGTTATTPTGAAIASSSSSEITCKMCPAPSFSFSAYGATPAAAAGTCPACPAGGICVGGMVIPSQGCYQPHPRSATIRACPHIKACIRDFSAMQNLQGLQCANRAYLDPHVVDARPFTAMQCSRGYAGPFCSVCYRPGRNLWVAQQWKQSQSAQQQLQHQQRGYTVAGQPPVLVKPWSNFDPQEVYGQSNGRCSRCPHPALAWLGFLLARLFDMILIGLLSLLWLGFGWLSQSPAADAFSQLKEGRFKALTLRHSILGPRGSGSGGLGSGRRSLLSFNLKQQKPKDHHSPPILPSRSLGWSTGSTGSGKASLKSHKIIPPAAHGPGSVSSVASSMMQSPFMAAAHAAAAAHHSIAPAAGRIDESTEQPSSPGCGSNRLALKLLNPLSSIISSRGGSSSILLTSPTVGAATAPTVRFSSLGSSRLSSGGVSASSRGLRALGSQTLSRTLTGFYNLNAGPSMRWSAAVSLAHKIPQQEQGDQKDQKAGDKHVDLAEGAAIEARLSALLLMAVQHLACLVQVVLDAAQIAAVVLSLDLVYFLPDWAATGMSAVLITQATTWQWMAFDCLLPGQSGASGAVFEAILVLLMPVIYAAVLFPVMYSIRRRAEQYLNYKTSTQQQQQQQQVAAVTSHSSYGSHMTGTASGGTAGSAAGRNLTAANWLVEGRHLSPDQSVEAVEQSPFATAAAVAAAAAAAAAAETDTPADSDALCPHPAAAGSAATVNNAHHASTGHQRDVSFRFSDAVRECPSTPKRMDTTPEHQQQQYSWPSSSRPQLSLLGRAQVWWHSFWPLSQSSRRLIASVAVASMAYSFSFYANNLVSAFTCMGLAGKPTLPSEIHLTGSYWVPDMQLQCWRGHHAAVAALAILIGIPMLLGYLFLLLVLAWPERQEEQQPQPQQSPHIRPPGAATEVAAGPISPLVPGHLLAAAVAVAKGETATAAEQMPEQRSQSWQQSPFADRQVALPPLRSESLPAAPPPSAALTPTLSSRSSGLAQSPEANVHDENVEPQDHLESLGPFARAAATSAADTALPPVSGYRSPPATAAAPAGASPPGLNRLHSSPPVLNLARSVPVDLGSNSSSGPTAAASLGSSRGSGITSPGGRPGYVETPSGLVSSRSLLLPHGVTASSFGLPPSGLSLSRSFSSSTGTSMYPPPQLVSSASGQLMLQTQFGLVPAGSGLVETALGLKHTRSGRIIFCPPLPPGLVSPNFYNGGVEPQDRQESFGAFGMAAEAAAAAIAGGPAAESVTDPVQPHLASSDVQATLDSSGPGPHQSSLAPSGPSRLMETPSGPVLLPATAAAAGVPYAVPIAVQAGTSEPTPPPTAPHAAAGGSGSSSSASSDAMAQKKGIWLVRWCNKWISMFVMWFVGLPGQVLEPPVRYCRQHWTQPAGITGVTCAGLGVWNEWCWYWLPVRELVKFVLVAAAAGSAMRAPQVQTLVLLLLVILAAALSWRVQAGCSTSMNRMQYAAHCWLQLLVLLVLLMTLQGVNADAYGAVVLGLLALVLGQCGVLLACLVWRCCVTGRELSEVGLQQTTGTEPGVAAAAAGKDVSSA